MRVVLLGGAGYIGSVIGQHLARRGHDLVVVDDLIYAPDPARRPAIGGTFVRGDFRSEGLLHEVLPGADAVVHLGGLVGEPACAVDEALSVELNFAAPVLAGEVAASVGVLRFVFLSTCSVYGMQDGLVTEETQPNPLSVYAWTKLYAEQRLREVLKDHAELTVLRLATVFGLSPRMRLDSVVNSMAARAAATGEIPLRGGAAWRPLIHVSDVAECVRRAVDGEVTIDRGQPLVLNVGNDANNHTIAEIAQLAAASVPGARIRTEDVVTDHRDYRVSFARIAEVMPGACQTPVTAGIDEIVAAVWAGSFQDPTALEYDNLRGLRAALEAGRTAALQNEPMRRLAKEYDNRGRAESAPPSGYQESAAARYWGEIRLSEVPVGATAAEDAAVLCQGKPTVVSSAYGRWVTDCVDAMLPDLTGQRVVDLGCGVGRVLAALAPRCGSVTGVDLAPGMVERARARAAGQPNADVVVGSVTDVPLPTGTADVVLCLGVFEHIPAIHRKRALAEVSRLLRPAGQLLLELNNAASVLLSRAADDNPYRLGLQLDNGYFCELVDVETVLATAEHCGLAVVDRLANPFFSAVRHGIGEAVADWDGAQAGELFENARRLDLSLGRSSALGSVADQYMIRLVKR